MDFAYRLPSGQPDNALFSAAGHQGDLNPQYQGISLLMYGMFVAGLLLWLIYGVLISNMAVSMANLLTLLFALPILVIKYQNR